VSALDWGVLVAALAFFVAYGVWRGRGARDLSGYLLANRALPAYAVALSVMATQASAITFLSTPGQGFADGLRFVQFYFGLPFAMIALGFTAVPAFHRMKVFTAYEYLEQRFGRPTRVLAALLFLVQRGLAVGLTIYAPALVLSVLLGWELRWTCALLGALAVVYTTSGGSKAVAHAHVLQFLVILGAIALAFVLILRALPAGVGLGDATALAARLGRINPIQTRFDLNDRYNLWSGLIGGFFLQLSYFGTDQSQVGRYLGGRSVRESRLGLLANGAFKIPMQFGILFLGAMLAVFYLFAPAPLSFDPVTAHRMATGAQAREWRALESDQRAAEDRAREAARAIVAARRARDAAASAAAAAALDRAEDGIRAARAGAARLIERAEPGAPTSDTNYVFLLFVLHVLPAGVIGLVLAAIFAASMNSTASELNALASTSMVDGLRLLGIVTSERGALWASRLLTLGWAAFAVAFAETVARLGSLIEAVNILGSLFYGTILGIFLTAFLLERVGGRAVFAAAIVAEGCVIACFRFTRVSFLWYNVVGCLVVMIVGSILSPLWPRRVAPPAS